MKKMIFLVIFATIFVCNTLVGQVQHGVYNSSMTPNPETILSAVTVIDPNSELVYMVGTDNNKNLFVTKLDINYQPPIPVNSNSFSFNMNNATGKVFLKDGFVDTDGNIVVYGYVDDTYKYGTFVKVSISAGIPTSIKYAITSVAHSQIIDGCWSKQSPNTKTYSFISAFNNGVLCRYNATTFSNLVCKHFLDDNSYMTSISWDEDNKKTIVSGFKSINTNGDTSSQNTLSQIVGYIDWTAFQNLGNFQLFTTNNYISSEYTNKHVLAGNGFYDDGIVFLCQDIRNEYDGLWMMQYDYINDEVYSNTAYTFPINKVFIIDVGHDFMNFFVLGHHNGSVGTSDFERRYIAQFDLFNPTTYIAKHLDYIDLDEVSGSTYYKVLQAFQSNINYNVASENMISTGAIPGKAQIYEILDLNTDSCDNTEITLTPINISYSQSSMTVPEITEQHDAITFSNWTQNTSTNYPLSMGVECLTAFSGFSNNDDFAKNLINEEKSNIENNINANNQNSGIIITNNKNEFVCDNFDGECSYQIFNIIGSHIMNGSTENGKTNYLNNLTTGTYIILVTDSKGNFSNNKIIITE